jgi:catechol 2,3-dioxygenase-like lactoylglutathione lyase family enzyme
LLRILIVKPNIHVHLSASNLAASAAFYEALFGAPVKVKPGYRKFLPTFAPLNLALSERQPGAASLESVSHLGIQFEARDEVTAQLARVKALGLPVREEMGVDCCHANQDKFWIRDPDGVDWEFYVLNFDLESETPPRGKTTACCASQAQCR